MDKKSINKITGFLMIFSLLLLFVLPLTKVYAKSMNTYVDFQVDKPNAPVGDIVTVSVFLNNINNLYGVSLDLNYNSNQGRIYDILKTNPFLVKNTYSNVVENNPTTGALSLFSTLIGKQDGITSKRLELFKFKFKVNKEGTFKLDNLNIKLSDKNGQPILFDKDNLNINVYTPSKLANFELVNKDKNILVNQSLKLKATTSYGTNPQFKYWIKKDNENWQVISDYSNNSELIWMPKEPGNYMVSCYTKSELSKEQLDDYKIINLTVTDKPDLEVLSNSSIICTDETLNITAKSNFNNVLYKFWINYDNNWKVVQDYSTNNQFNYKFDKPGTYLVSTYIKHKDSINQVDNYKIISIEVLPKVTLSTSNNLFVNSKVNISAKANLNSDYLYKFLIKEKEDDNWKVLQDYSQSANCSWVPSTSGDKILAVNIKNKYSNISKEIVLPITVQETSIDVVSFNGNDNLQIGDKIKLKIDSNNPNAEFKYWLLDTNNTWHILKSYSNSKTLEFNVDKYGNYKLSIYAKDTNSKQDPDNYKIIDFKLIKPELAIKTVDVKSDNDFFANYPLKINAISNSPNCLYKFWVKEVNDSDWHIIQEYSKSSEISWKPNSPGKYIFSVYAKDINSNKTVDTYKITNPIEIKGPIISNIELTSLDENYNIIKVYTNKDKDIVYKYWYKKDDNWTILKDYSTDNTIKLPKNLKGTLSVYIKDKHSENVVDNYQLYELK